MKKIKLLMVDNYDSFTYNIVQYLGELGAEVEVHRNDAISLQQIEDLAPAQIVISPGPCTPNEAGISMEAIHTFAGRIPLLGICLGHQLLSRALGGTTYKLPFGHHGGNHPVQHLASGHVEITSQNHNFCVDAESLGGRVAVTHLNLNDQTNEGMRVLDAPAFSVQYHPEAGPGPHDSRYLFEQFAQLMQNGTF